MSYLTLFYSYKYKIKLHEYFHAFSVIMQASQDV